VLELDTIAKALIGLGGTGGGIVAAVMWFSWRDERKERQALQAKVIQLLSDTISSREQLASALEKVASRVGA
jgi:hypothetical protein